MYGAVVEENLLESVLTTLISKDGGAATAHAFLDANSEYEPCRKLLKMWNQYVFLPHYSHMANLVSVRFRSSVIVVGAVLRSPFIMVA